jgi:PleD family two-component response regulator
VRREDVCGRWGEKTFAAILPGAAHRGAAIFANKVRGDAETTPITVPDGTLRVRISAGISSYRDQGDAMNADGLLMAAEQALSEAKKRGGNRVFIDKAVLRRQRRLIILADADPTVVDPAEDLLSMDDYRVVRVESVSALLETLKYKRPDLLILDMHLEGQDEGTDLIDSIHSLYPDSPVPIVGLSGPGQGDGPSGRVGVDRYLTKPFSVAVLRSVARDLIEPRRVTGPVPRAV